MSNVLLNEAVHAHRAVSTQGMLERMFTLAFKGFVYPQIWEDPELDMEALAIEADSRVVTIASGGCNVMSYLTAGPRAVVALDLNPAHVALTRLKLAAVQHLPNHEVFFRFFGHADEKDNTRAYDRFLRDRLDAETRAFWEKQVPLRGRRINMFSRNLYRFGLLGRFIGTVHLLARLHGRNPRHMLAAASLEEQRRLFEELLAPMFDKRAVRWLCRLPVSLYGLGIPPAQYAALVADSGGDMAGLLRSRLERLACDFPFEDNYFAWQAFGRSYDREDRRAVPPYLHRDNYEKVREGAGRVEVRHASVTDFLADEAPASVDRLVLLDAQDWMSDAQLTTLWSEITRTARPGARVIFRTAGADSPLPGSVSNRILDQWSYDGEACRTMVARDRSSIYGGFHLYRLAN